MAFLVTGCGRSGTTFLTRLFNELGVRTSHEEFFTAYTPPVVAPHFPGWLRETQTAGEVSGLAAPYMRLLKVEVKRFSPVKVAQLVRNPVAVIASLTGLGDYQPKSFPLANIKYNFRHIPELSREDTPVVLAMKYWLYWNRIAVAPRYRVEQVCAGQGEHAIQMLRDLGVTTQRTECAEALEKLGVRQNGGPRDPSVTWKTLPESRLKDKIAADAVGYGYTMQELEAYRPTDDICSETEESQGVKGT